ncbi:hypothetical protein CN495_08235 [Bacillus thuringiensis]|uniref:Uncharacterized protein n=1 Tax=Bacillus thuringiensis TaxID=1428 RepID=A0ABD6SND0_BACTU|nr:hypothetical protein [Bacillus thuringiensis]PER55732.1 hypothetical protein CN495_08235 [Bacillus thuringiensis]
MAEIKLNEDGSIEAKMSKEEVNAIALLLGASSDKIITERAEEWEVEHFSSGTQLTNLYYAFRKYSDVE